MLQMFNNNDLDKKSNLSDLDKNSDNSKMHNTYEVIRPKSPPKLMLENSPLLTSLPKILQSTGTKKDSFFGGRNNSSIDNEYLMDYIVSNEEGEMSSLLTSNP